jgi:hypothetical protein
VTILVIEIGGSEMSLLTRGGRAERMIAVRDLIKTLMAGLAMR